MSPRHYEFRSLIPTSVRVSTTVELLRVAGLTALALDHIVTRASAAAIALGEVVSFPPKEAPVSSRLGEALVRVHATSVSLPGGRIALT